MSINSTMISQINSLSNEEEEQSAKKKIDE